MVEMELLGVRVELPTNTPIVLLRERDVHAVAAERIDDSETGLYL